MDWKRHFGGRPKPRHHPAKGYCGHGGAAFAHEDISAGFLFALKPAQGANGLVTTHRSEPRPDRRRLTSRTRFLFPCGQLVRGASTAFGARAAMRTRDSRTRPRACWGQAVVGTIETRGRGSIEIRGSTPTQSKPHPTVWIADKGREPMPVTGYAERALPDARRALLGGLRKEIRTPLRTAATPRKRFAKCETDAGGKEARRPEPMTTAPS
jgi:hypothetical protein